MLHTLLYFIFSFLLFCILIQFSWDPLDLAFCSCSDFLIVFISICSGKTSQRPLTLLKLSGLEIAGMRGISVFGPFWALGSKMQWDLPGERSDAACTYCDSIKGLPADHSYYCFLVFVFIKFSSVVSKQLYNL